MRIFIYALLSLALAAAAFGQDEPKKKPAASEKKPAAEGTLATPFGVAKTTKPAVAKAKPKKVRQNWKVEKDGQGFKFSKKTPFGPSSWTRTEAELSADERDVAERSGLLAPEEEPAEEETETAAKQL
jgi:hypothetical protein